MADDEAAGQADGDATQVGYKWGDDILPKRKVWLEGRLQAWKSEADHGKKRGPFAGDSLNGADVYWLAARSLAASADEAAIADWKTSEKTLSTFHGVPELHLEGALLGGADLQAVDLEGAHLEGADLHGAHLQGRRYMGTDKDKVDLEFIRRAMKRRDSEVEVPDVFPPADLHRAFFDRATQFQDATLGNADLGYVAVADTRWGEVNLAVVDWPESPILGDEVAAQKWKPTPFQPDPNDKRPVRQQRRDWSSKRQAKRLGLYRAAARAYRQLATVLRTQGMNDEADRFAYRANLLQRAVFVRQRAWGRAFFSGLLDLVAGYGYRPRRSVVTYALTITIFAVLDWCVTNDVSLTHGLFTHAITLLGMTPPPASHEHLQGYEAVVVSMTSFHGRGFFQPIQSPGDRVAILAALEAAVGLLIEITFIATFTQRFFAR